MASWSFLSVLLLLIILSLANFLHAQIQYHATTQAPASWVNNNISIPSPFSSARIILLNKKPISITSQYQWDSLGKSTTSFACGFYTYYGEKNPTYFGISLTKMSTDRQKISSFGNLVWVANRNKPVGENATLDLLRDGDLVLRNEDGTLIWSTGTSDMSVVGMKMMEDGNLVLYDRNNRTIWQSFEYPSDVLLPGQKLKVGRRLVASKSKTNWSEGSFYLSVTSQGLFGFYQADDPQMYFNFPVLQTVESIELNYNTSNSLTLYAFPASSSSEPNPIFTTPLNQANMSYMRFDPDYTSTSVDLLADVMGECDYPTICGNYGLCSNAGCSCPQGFDQDNVLDAYGKYGCSEIIPSTCEKPLSQYFVTYEDVYHFSYVDPDAAALKGTDKDSCQEACLKNCSCKAALFQHHYNSSNGNCFLPSPVLSLIHDGKARNNYQSRAFIKVSDKREDESSSPTTSIRKVIISGSTIGTFLLVGLIAWLLYFRRNRGSEEGLEDYLDQLSEMPRRFTYKELKMATRDFHKKLGGGGFGSVFEGSLPNGEKIAVKRLDSLGQGKKEFLAEIKTIGSIHHVNLVKLIGFCPERLHRILVYEFMCNGSLNRWIFHEVPLQPPLRWQVKKTIILDIAKGLAYLHEDCRQRIVHLDIKPQNILLDANLRAKISDFGLCKLIDRDQSQVITTMRGTPGYLAPELLLNSVVSEKVDVYSFGIVIIETICGRKNLDSLRPEEGMQLLPTLMKNAEDGQLIDMIDKSNQDMLLHWSEVVEMMRIAIWCLQGEFTRRPSMSMVVKVLEGTADVEDGLNFSIDSPTGSHVALETSSSLVPSILSGPR